MAKNVGKVSCMINEEKESLIIIAAYNEEKKLEKLVQQLKIYKKNTLFIDDGSYDRTYEILKKNGFRIIHYNENKGVSYAIKQGINYAYDQKYKSVIMLDADGQHNPQYIPYFYNKIKENDFVMGNRFSIENVVPDVKRNSNTFGTCLVEVLFGQYIQDTSCGFKAFKLNNDIIKYIQKSTDYSIVFDLLIYNIINKKKIAVVNMEATYFPNEFWYTRKSELDSLVKAMEPFLCKEELINKIKLKLNRNTNFDIQVAGIPFFFIYLKEYDGYIVQADKNDIYKYHSNRKQDNEEK